MPPSKRARSTFKTSELVDAVLVNTYSICDGPASSAEQIRLLPYKTMPNSVHKAVQMCLLSEVPASKNPENLETFATSGGNITVFYDDDRLQPHFLQDRDEINNYVWPKSQYFNMGSLLDNEQAEEMCDWFDSQAVPFMTPHRIVLQIMTTEE